MLIFVLLLALPAAADTDAAERLRREFRNPPREYTQVPFWFWNGDLNKDGVRRQIHSMDKRGVHGFVIHARMGLSKEIGYMTPRWLDLVAFAVEEAKRRNMIVYLYDEGMYPSGSAHGKVVEQRPDLASQGLRMDAADFDGPLRAHAGAADHAVLLERAGHGKYKPPGRVVTPGADIEIPAGRWTLFRFTRTPSGGVIRGVHFDEEDNLPNAPPSADLLNPEATARFIAATHEVYWRRLRPYFGTTIRGIFTDEPSILGRRAKRGLRPWTGGLLPQINKHVGYDFEPYLPFLWVEATGGLERTIRADYKRALAAVLNETYYKPISDWCAAHRIALTGHPSGGGDMLPQIYFQQPGQDVVWRWVLPGPTALEGEQSLTGKTASSMALHLGRDTVVNECYGAYGWRLTMSEMKWLADWLFVRGANLLMPHAFYYSTAGPRLHERPPDLAWSNLWWEHYGRFSAYTNRISWLMRGGTPVADVAILAPGGVAPWRAARALFESQIDFYYLEESFLDRANVHGGRLHTGGASYAVVVLDGLSDVRPETRRRIEKLLRGGVKVIACDSELNPHPLAAGARPLEAQPARAASTQELLKMLHQLLPLDLQADPPVPDLRYTHRVKDRVHFYLLTNEGNERLRTWVTVRQLGVPEIWNAETGETSFPETVRREENRIRLRIDLHPRNSTILAFTGREAAPAAPPPEPDEIPLPSDGWTLSVAGRLFRNIRLGSWTNLAGLDSFSGTAWYEREIRIPHHPGKRLVIDLGDVRDFAALDIGGKRYSVRLWPPYRFDISGLSPGSTQTVRIAVTNTRANELTKEKLPSGLLGPVRLLVVGASR